jgi:hypothetical protein
VFVAVAVAVVAIDATSTIQSFTTLLKLGIFIHQYDEQNKCALQVCRLLEVSVHTFPQKLTELSAALSARRRVAVRNPSVKLGYVSFVGGCMPCQAVTRCGGSRNARRLLPYTPTAEYSGAPCVSHVL